MAQRRSRTSADLPLSLAPRMLFVTGKGGVGKTTVAAALAKAYSAAGVRTLLVQLEGQAEASALLSNRPVAYDPTPLSPGLWAMTLDTENALKEYARLRLKVKLIADKLVGNPIFQQFAGAAPAFRELLVLGKLWALSEQVNSRRKPQYEAIIVDSPATGHGLSLLGMAGVVAKMFPIGPIAAEAREVDAFVKDPARAGVVLVSLPEEMPVNEAIDLHAALDEQGVDVAAVVLNSVLAERFTQEEADTIAAARELDDLDPATAGALDSALYEHERFADQQLERARLEAAVGDVHTLPYVHTHELTRAQVGDLARWLTPKGLKAQQAAAKRARAQAGVK